MTPAETLHQYATRAAPVCGWPKWRANMGDVCVLAATADHTDGAPLYPACSTIGGIMREVKDDCDALCIWRDWVLAYLCGKYEQVEVAFDSSDDMPPCRISLYDPLAADGEGAWYHVHADTYDEALLAAVEVAK